LYNVGNSMNFHSKSIGDKLLDKLAQATKVQIASAFFCPNDPLLNALKAVPSLELIVSEEFTINDPYKLEQLTKADIRSIPPDHTDGKLHAKVFIVTLLDASQWVLLGSANLTQQGLFANQEACIDLRSASTAEESVIGEIRRWFHDLFAKARHPDLAEAKTIYDQRSRYRLEPRPSTPAATQPEYWALKTTSGGADAQEHWPHFLSEGMVAIGWEELDVDPSKVDDSQLRAALKKILDPEKPGSVDFGVRTIRDFMNLPNGSIVVVCRGLVPKQIKPVHIYAFARVTGPFRSDPMNGTQWRFKRDAVIQPIGTSLPAATFTKAVQKESFRQTMHRISADTVQRLADELGVPVEV
jgi:HKD family nuclease